MAATTFAVVPDTPRIRRRDWKIIRVVGAAHACSHFFQLVFPTLYLSLAAEYGYDFGKLGLLASVFFLVSCLGQASSGFVVDRIGPLRVLQFGLTCFVIAGVLIGLSNGYLVLLMAAVIGGAGNSVFHPVDYSIINEHVSAPRLGHAFSAHGLTGNLGWALTPLYMAAFIHLANWRVAAFAAAALVALVLFMVWLERDLLSGSPPDARHMSESAGSESDLARKSVRQTLVTLLAQPALWGAFFFFACTSLALSAVQNYTIPMLGDLYGIDNVLAGTALSAYMVAAALGMAAGGFIVGTTARTEFTVALSLVLAGVLLVVLGSGVVPSSFAIMLMGLAGFCSGVSAPSRDMLIRRVAPKGATGTVYGLVYSGMDVGSSLAPVSFGLLLDAGMAQGPWYGAATGFLIAALLAIWIAKSAAKAPALLAQTS